jgi:hypothetical protein
MATAVVVKFDSSGSMTDIVECGGGTVMSGDHKELKGQLPTCSTFISLMVQLLLLRQA